MLPDRKQILKSITFRTSRSGGKGGQNVNKVSSKVELIFNPATTEFLNDTEKERLKISLKNRLDSEGLLHIVSQEDRSQLLNKEKAIVKLTELLKKSLLVQKRRKPTSVPNSITEKRLKNKMVNAFKKENRKKPDLD